MNKLPIADCQLPINGSFHGCCFARSRHDSCPGVGFRQQDRQFFDRHQAGLNQQFKPQGRFIGFFFNRAYLGNELRAAPRSARRAMIRGYRSSAANNLLRDSAAGIVIFGNGTGQFDNPQRKSLGSGFAFDWVHGVKLQIQSAIGNRQSAITR